MTDLPENWKLATLGAVCSKPQYGWTSKASRSGSIKYLRTTDISNGHIDWDSVPYCASVPADIKKYRLHANDILVSRAGSVGISYILTDVPCDVIFASYLIRFNPRDNVLPKYIAYYLKSDPYWREISEFTAGIAIPNVNASKLSELKLPLPPIVEQKRIVVKLDKLLSEVQSVQSRLDKIPVLLKRFRQSGLSAACSGRLTADWRGQHPTKQKPTNVENVRECIFDDIPASWAETYVGSTISDLCYGTSKKCSYLKTGLPVLRIPNIADGAISHADLKYADFEANEIAKLTLKPGDILIIRSNGSVSLVGKTAIATEGETGFIFAGYLMRLRPKRNLIYSEFLHFALSSAEIRVQIEIPARSTSGVNNMNSDEVKKLQFALPPLKEQEEIVRRVKKLFKLADDIENRYKTARESADKLTQSILAKAFRGDLTL